MDKNTMSMIDESMKNIDSELDGLGALILRLKAENNRLLESNAELQAKLKAWEMHNAPLVSRSAPKQVNGKSID